MPSKKESFDYSREERALGEQYADLIEKAGIAAQIAQCEGWLEPHYSEDRHLPPLLTDARQEERKRQEAHKFQSYRRCMRDVLFSLADPALRKEIIAIERKMHALRIKSAQHDLWDAQHRRDIAGKPNSYSGFFAALAGAAIVLLGERFAGQTGAIASAVFALIMAMFALQELEWLRHRSMERAAAEVADLRETVNEIVQNEVFLLVEEDTGEKHDESGVP
jgi:hypothetical protein